VNGLKGLPVGLMVPVRQLAGASVLWAAHAYRQAG